MVLLQKFVSTKQVLWVSLFTLSLGGWPAAKAYAANGNNQAGGQACHILVVGDSLSAAYGLPVEQGWVALMERRLKEKFPRCTLTNASISGETTAGGKTRLPALLKQHKPTQVVLELGANDGLRGLPIETMKNNLSSMIDMARNAQAKTVLVGMQIPPNYGPAYSRRFGEAFTELAKQHRVPLVPFLLNGFAQNPDAFQADGIHPNAAQQPRMLDNVWAALEGTIKTR
ncbi:MAG TPA: arylesterase [Limnobacter sp.]|uniref:arylesterase n=1 Tax=Limnobacter sp. TaxID=2003368 RepID=UPI002EDB798A